jgi:hypothetical protein
MAHDAPIEATGPSSPASAAKPGSYADGQGAWWVPTWYVLLCALPLAGAFFLPVPLMMVMRASRPPIDFITAGWIGIAVGWALWLFAGAAWLVAGWLFSGQATEIDEMASWWRRTTQMWLLLVLAWGTASTIGIWVFYLVVGHTIGLDSIQ